VPAVYPKTKTYQIENVCFKNNIFVLYLAITVSKANYKAGEVKLPEISHTDDHESSKHTVIEYKLVRVTQQQVSVFVHIS